MSNVHNYLIEKLFFQYIDRAVPAEDTPLLRGTLDNGEPLLETIVVWFGLNPLEAETVIEMARQEVKL